MKKIDLVQGTQPWHDFRKDKVGGSDIASIKGVKGAFKKRKDVLAEKLGHVTKISDFQQAMFDKGHAGEELVRSHGFDGSHYKFIPAVVIHEKHDRFFASLDGIDEEKKMLLEVKTCMNENTFSKYCAEIPEHYYAQVQWQMFCTDYSQSLIVFLYQNQTASYTIERNDAYIEEMIRVAYAFINDLDESKILNLPAPIQALPPSAASRIITLKKDVEHASLVIKEAEAEIKLQAEALLKEFGATRLENEFITIQTVERQGSIKYSDIPEVKKMHNSYLESFRGKPSSYVTVKLKKEGSTNE